MINKGMMSSKTDLWSTPQKLFDRLDAIYQFTLDPCATKDNAKCPWYYDKADNGLLQSWDGERVFMNPPYGRQIGNWIKKAYVAVDCEGAEIVVCLVPARTDTAWWHNYCMQGDITFIRGRLKFGNSKNSAPFPSAIVVFKKPLKL